MLFMDSKLLFSRSPGYWGQEKKMKTIIVAARKNDPSAYGVQKYDNNERWNVPGGTAPNGVSATRYLKKITVDASGLSSLARFLVENVPVYCAGTMPAFNHDHRVKVYNGKTEAQMLRLEGRRNAENIIKCYDLETVPCKIDDWLFSIIEPSQTAAEYLESEAQMMLKAGAVRIQIGQAEWRLI